MGTLTAGARRRPRAFWIVPLIILVLLVGVGAGVVYLGSRPLSTLLVALSSWLHTVATIVWVGYFLFTSLIYLPVLERQMPATVLRDLLEQVAARLRPFFGGALLVFLVSGTYLMLINANYSGVGNFFANPWSGLIVIKHVLVRAFLALALFSERAFLAKISEQKPEALQRFRWALHANAILGVLILLLTSIAQAG